MADVPNKVISDNPTEEELAQFEEDLKDRWWRLNHLYFITTDKGQCVQFKMNWAQRTFYWSLWFLNLILKSRQQGFTTFIQILILDACLFRANIRAGVIAHTRDDAQIFFRDKIKFAYDNLPDILKERIPAIKNDAGELLLANNSSIRVGVSMRSGTLQYLHISEFGKICARTPERAREVITGALNTVAEGNFVFIESTAEGAYGRFYELCQTAMKQALEKIKLTKLDYKFHFYSWFQKPTNKTNPEGVPISREMVEYFETLEVEHGIELTDAQKAWYVKTEAVQQDDMKREHPSFPDEAFEQAIEGAYLTRQMRWLRKNNRITRIPYDPRLNVRAFFDIGRNDMNSIWFHQRTGTANLFIEHYQNHGESIQFYGNYMKRKAEEEGWVFETIYLPHDGEVIDYSRGDNKERWRVLADMGFEVECVPKVPALGEAIQAMRDVLPTCFFDAENCDSGIKALDAYQREWDEKLGAFKEHHLHNWASHPAAAFQTFARGYASPVATEGKTRKPRKKNWRTR